MHHNAATAINYDQHPVTRSALSVFQTHTLFFNTTNRDGRAAAPGARLGVFPADIN